MRPGTNTYDLTADGLRFAISYTKVHNRTVFAADRGRVRNGATPSKPATRTSTDLLTADARRQV
jgi:hypothetical protein